MLFPHDCDSDITEEALQVNDCHPDTLTVNTAGVVIVTIPSAVVVPANVYDTPDHTGILETEATAPPTKPDGVETCDGHVVPIVRDSIGRARLFVSV